MSSATSRLLRLFSGASPESASDDPRESSATGREKSLSEIANERLMGEIAAFLINNRLGVTARNLLVAHSIFTGEDPQLARQIARRANAGLPITQEWIDAQIQIEDPVETVNKLTDQLEQSIEGFAETTRSARDTAADYNTTLSRQVREVQARGVPGASLHTIIEFAEAMLTRTRALESEMTTREEETRELRESLARARRDADVDHLTGLPNRRAFEALLDRHYREAQAEIDQLCVAFCDIDNFKRINDQHGHDTGDRVIKAVANALDRLSNEKCHVARHGGEEFVLLFRGLSKKDAREKLDGVRETFSERRFVNRLTDDPIGRVTFSGGVADVFVYPTPRDALKAADEALYLAKEQGRNAVLSAP